MGDNWLVNYDACDRLATDILEKINERNRQQRHSNGYSQMSVKIRQALKIFESDHATLKQELIRASSSYYLTQREVERRQHMLDSLAVREKQILDGFHEKVSPTNQNALFGNDLAPLSGSVNWGFEETEATKDLSVHEIRQQQQQVIQEQDKGLEALSHVISRQKHLAYNIADEVDVQNELIDNITDHVEATDNRISRETRHVKIIDRKSNTCGYWVVFVLLLVAIIVVIAIPKH